MLNSSKKRAAGVKVRVLGLIVILFVSLATWLILQLAVGSDKLGFPAILMFFALIFSLTGIFYGAYAFIKKRTLMYVIGAPSLIIGLIFILAMCHVYGWVIAVIAIALFVAAALGTFAFKADGLVIEMDNANDSGRKTYDEKKAEEAAMPKVEEEEKPLPEIKSFKN